MPKNTHSSNKHRDGPLQKKARIEKPSKKAQTPLKSSVKAHQPTPTQKVISPVPVKDKGKGKEKAALKPTVSPEHASLKSESKAPTNTPPDLGAVLPTMPSTFKVIAGSYEKLLYGLEGTVSVTANGEPEYHLKPIFIFPAHVSCIKAVAASPGGGKWLATGSADEIIKVWDLRRRKEVGGLMHHQGSITHLNFPSRSHLLSTSEDGTLCLFHARDWSVLRVFKGHKARVNCVAVHPSGKVALSVGKDKALRMWDLMRGKGVASTKLGKEGEVVRWSTTGSHFVVQSGSTIDVYTTKMILMHTITHPSRIHDVKFVKRTNSEGEVLLVGAEDRNLSIYDNLLDQDATPVKVAIMVGHANRVKAVQTHDIALPSSATRKSTTIVCTASSDGKIHLYDLNDLPPPESSTENTESRKDQPPEIQPRAIYDSNGTRLTCLTLADGEAVDDSSSRGKIKKRQLDEGNQEEDEEDSEFGSEDDQQGKQDESEVEEELEEEDEDEEEEEEMESE